VLRALTVLIVCQFCGEVTARAAGLPLPGPVIGLVLLLRHLSLLFVPAGVGIVTQLDALERDWKAILVAILVSTALGLAVTGWLMQRLSRGNVP
jgi:holin-like protein